VVDGLASAVSGPLHTLLLPVVEVVDPILSVTTDGFVGVVDDADDTEYCNKRLSGPPPVRAACILVGAVHNKAKRNCTAVMALVLCFVMVDYDIVIRRHTINVNAIVPC
jgi:hypothetical protein